MNQIPITRPVRLDVHVTVLRPDKSPAAGVPLRLVLGTVGNWQLASAGTVVLTADDGTADVTEDVVLAARRRHVPASFFARLMVSRESTRQAHIGVGLEYAGRPWLSVVTIDRRLNGTSARLDPMQVFGRASDGRFTDDVPQHDGTWHKRLPNGKVAGLPGFTVTAATLDPESNAPDNAAWRVRLTLLQWEPYVMPLN